MGPVDVAIVGGGASGTLVAAQLLRQARTPLRIVLLERSGAVARGLAYGPAEPCHLLNVPASGMSAWPDDPDDFVRWSGAAPDAFVPRSVYGAYLEAVLTQAHSGAAPGVSFHLVCGEAVSASLDGGAVRIELEDGRRIASARAVLALGNFASCDLAVDDGGLYSSALYRRSPWQRGALEGIPAGAPVVLLGTGLTMVDAVLALQRRGHRGRIHALSRHGLLPHVHGGTPGPAQPHIGALGVRGLLRALRACALATGDWRSPLDALRPLTQRIWRRLPDAERRRFLRHLRTHWDVHRHRMAPEVAAGIARARSRGQLLVHAGRIESFAVQGGHALARYRPRGERTARELRGARIVNCTGPAWRLADARNALVDSLIERRLAVPDSLGMGLATDGDGALLGAGGGRLLTLGALRRGELWESTAIPELRGQAQAVAARIVTDLEVALPAEAMV